MGAASGRSLARFCFPLRPLFATNANSCSYLALTYRHSPEAALSWGGDSCCTRSFYSSLRRCYAPATSWPRTALVWLRTTRRYDHTASQWLRQAMATRLPKLPRRSDHCGCRQRSLQKSKRGCCMSQPNRGLMASKLLPRVHVRSLMWQDEAMKADFELDATTITALIGAAIAFQFFVLANL